MIILAAVAAIASVQLVEFDLPSTEAEALAQVEEGILDSALWETIRDFYREPIRVAHGELRLLKNIFPYLPDDLPVTSRRLAKYEPWTNDKLEEFFQDFPTLRSFEPLLSFGYSGIGRMGNIAFAYRRTRGGVPPSQRVRFGFSPVGPFSAEGSLYFSQQYARWARRRIRLDIPEWFSAVVGNYGMTINNGLFYGHFPGTDETEDDLRANWLYGHTRSWNGVSMKTSRWSAFEVQGFYHTRPSEGAAGIKAELDLGKRLSAYSGVSVLEERTAGDTVMYAHFGVRTGVSNWKFSAHSGVDVSSPARVPLSVSAVGRTPQFRYRADVVWLPEGFCAPRSRTFRSVQRILDEGDTLSQGVISAAMSVTDSALFVFQRTLLMGYTAGNRASGVNAGARLECSVPFGMRFWYRFKNQSFVKKPEHRIGLSTDVPVSNSVTVGARLNTTIRAGELTLLRSETYCWIAPVGPLELEPFFELRTYGRGETQYAAGMKQELRLFERTWARLRIALPFSTTEVGDTEIRAETWFLF